MKQKITQRIDVDSLKLQLLQRKITVPRFRWHASPEAAYDILLAAYQAEVEYRQRHYTPSTNTTEALMRTAQYLTGDSSKFGLMFCGTAGNGKTTLLLAIRAATNYLNDLGYFEDAKTTVTVVTGKEVIHAADNYDTFKALRDKPILAIDDIGHEPVEVLNYGNAKNPVIDLLEYRYSEQLTTLLTTNATAEEIKNRYGRRLADRFNEMLEVIIFRDSSYRTQQ